MKKKVLGRFIIIGVLAALAVFYLLPNIFHSLPGWWKQTMPSRGITLGLDLRGGLHLVFEVQGDKAVEITLDHIAESIRNDARSKDMEASVEIKDGRIVLEHQSPGMAALIREDYPSLDAKGNGIYELPAARVERIKKNSVEQALETIRNRIDQFGVAEPVIQRQGENEIIVQLPGVKNPKRAIDIIGKTAQLEFKIVDDKSPVAAELPGFVNPGEEEAILQQFKDKIPPDDQILFQKEQDPSTGRSVRTPVLVNKRAVITGDLLSEARVSIDTRYNEPYVALTFNAAGAKIFEDVTAKHVQDRMAIVLDGTVYSAPVIRERIPGGNASITGGFSTDEAKDLAIVLRAGALPAPVKMLQNVTVGPSLGRDSIEAGKRAGVIGAFLVVFFMIFYYRLSGVIADFALGLNILFLLGSMAALKATLTLPGIAGVILAVGMAVDSNVLMFERMREELRAGKTPRAAVDSGYDKAFWTIFDSHVTTLITALVLFQFGTGPIKGFAVTLSLGVAINLFTALVGTKTLFDFIHSRTEVKSLSI
jgi:preprotein translocase subunit SecD